MQNPATATLGDVCCAHTVLHYPTVRLTAVNGTSFSNTVRADHVKHLPIVSAYRLGSPYLGPGRDLRDLFDGLLEVKVAHEMACFLKKRVHFAKKEILAVNRA
jgi:hypothetical protein